MADRNGNGGGRQREREAPVIDNETGQDVGEMPGNELVEAGLAVGLVRAEIAEQVATARRFPRNQTRAVAAIVTLATMDAETAEECIYSLPRAGKKLRGPSIRLAEMILQSWGNCRAAAEVIAIDREEKVVIARGVYHDLETNAASMATVRRRIFDRMGRLFDDDMITITGNAACSIAKRNAILAGVPKSIWKQAERAAEGVIAKAIGTVSEGRDKAIAAFRSIGVKPEQVFKYLDLGGYDDLKLDDLVTLRAVFAAIERGDASVDEFFGERANGRHHVVADPLKNETDEAPAGAKTTAAPAQQQAAPEPEKRASAPETGGTGQSEREPDLADRAAGAQVGAGRAAEGKTAEQPKPKTEQKRQPESAAEPAKSATPEINDDTIEQAEKEGYECADMGMSKRTLPDEYKKTLLEKAWLRGYDKRVKEDANH